MLTLANSANRNHNLTVLGNPQTSWPSEMKTATDWFCRMFPVQVRVFGSPFLEQQGSDHIGLITSTPLVSNIDCLAACLGGDVRLGHRVIYYLPELQYYYYDPADQMYHATTADKLGNLYRALMARCAAEVKGEGHIANIFYTFRSDSVVKTVINRCKSLLAASEGYFGVKSQPISASKAQSCTRGSPWCLPSDYWNPVPAAFSPWAKPTHYSTGSSRAETCRRSSVGISRA